MKITDIKARKLLNSKTAWTIETTITLEDGSFGKASIPGGVSKGKTEVVSHPANLALQKIESLKDFLLNKDFRQTSLDSYLLTLDGTNDKSNLGGNVMLSISVSFAKAVAMARNIPLYKHIYQMHYKDVLDNKKLFDPKFERPEMMMLMLEGGLHGSNNASIQEFMAIVNTIDRGIEIYKKIQEELKRLKKSTNVGAEGAFSPDQYDNDQMLTLLAGFLKKETIALDIAASSFKETDKIPNYEELLNSYPITSIEDPYDEEDWPNWKIFAKKYNKKITVVTDDITTTNPTILKKAIKENIGNATIIKPNQIGTLTETLMATKLAQENGWEVIVSHRGSDTNDDFVADLAIGINADYVKFGSPARGERVAKYNRLMEIWNEIDSKEALKETSDKLEIMKNDKCMYIDPVTKKACGKKSNSIMKIQGENVPLCSTHYNVVYRLGLR